MRTRIMLLGVLLGCGTSSITGDEDGGNTPPPADASLDARVSCSSAQECASGQVCNPATSRCVTSLPCTTHTMCGKQAFCDEGTCAQNVLRGLCDSDDNCVGQETCEGGHCGCGGEVLTATAVAPNMLIALDRSGSMVTNSVPDTGGDSRWEVAVRVLKDLTMDHQNGIRFGLLLWPGNNKQCESSNQSTECRGSVVGVPLGATTSGPIGSYLDTTTTCGLRTPIGGTMSSLVDFEPLGDTTRDNYVVLVTDGDENCGGNGPAAVTELRERTPPVRTFVIGFGGGVNAGLLNQMATNGGTARPGTTKYYQADNENALNAAFEEIAGSVAPCSYTLSGDPDDPSRIFVFLGDTQIARDPSHAMGWDFQAADKRLTFYGPTCDQVRGGGELSVTFGCPIID